MSREAGKCLSQQRLPRVESRWRGSLSAASRIRKEWVFVTTRSERRKMAQPSCRALKTKTWNLQLARLLWWQILVLQNHGLWLSSGAFRMPCHDECHSSPSATGMRSGSPAGTSRRSPSLQGRTPEHGNPTRRVPRKLGTPKISTCKQAMSGASRETSSAALCKPQGPVSWCRRRGPAWPRFGFSDRGTIGPEALCSLRLSAPKPPTAGYGNHSINRWGARAA